MKENEHKKEQLDKKIAELEEELIHLKAERSADDLNSTGVQDRIEYYREIFNHMSEGIFVIKDQHVVFTNPALTKLLGYSREEIYKRNLFEVIHPDHQKEVQKNYQMRLGGKDFPPYEIQVLTKDEKYRWFRIKGEKINWHNDNAVLVFMQDITEELAIKESLEKREHEISEIFSNAPLGIFQTTSTGDVLHINTEMANILGFKNKNEALKEYPNISKKLYADPKKRLEFIDLLKKKGEVKNFEYLAVTAQNKYKWLKMDARISKKNTDGSFIIDGFTEDIDELKSTNLKLRDNEKKYRSLIEQSNDAIFILSPEGYHLEVNDKAIELTGYSREEFLNMGYRNLVAKEHLEDSENKLDKLKQGIQPKTYEKTFVAKSGEEIPVELTVSPVQDQNNQVKYILSIARDIRERKEAEIERNFLSSTGLELIHCNTLSEIKEFVVNKIYELLEKNAIITVADFNNQEGTWEMSFTRGLNKNLEKILKIPGFDINKMKGPIIKDFKNLTEGKLTELQFNFDHLTNGAISNSLGEKIVRILSLKKMYSISIHQQNIIYSNITILTKKDTKPINKQLIEAFMLQVSLFFEKRSAEHALAESEEMFRTLVQNQGEGAAIVNEEEVFEFANPMAEIIFGVGKGELTGKSLKEFIDDHTFELIEQQTQLRKKGNSSTYDIEIHNHKGEKRALLLTVTPQFTKDGDFEGSFAVFRDISDLKKVEKELKSKENKLIQINATKDKLFSIIGHDLKNPLNSMLGLTRLLKRNLHTSNHEKVLHYLTMIQQAGMSMSTLLENILNWSQTQYDVSNVHTEELSMQHLIEDSLKVVQASAENKNIQIVKHFTPSAIVYADQNMIKTVLRNLLSNAIKFTKPGGKISIETHASDAKVTTKIIDTGVGIPKKNLDALFNVKSTTSTTGTAGEQGTGLGLIICKEFIEQNRGEIWVEKSDKAGTVFCFYLPVALDVKRKASNENQKTKTSNISERSTILIVEDDELNFYFLHELLEDMNVTIHHAINGKQAVEIIDTHPEIDLVLMDLRMPEMNGFEATQAIKSKRPELPVIAQSAHIMPEDKRKAKEAGCDGFLEKPLIPQQVIEYLRNF